MDIKAYKRAWMANRRQEWFADKSCSKCRSDKQLELHHIDRSTKISHTVWSWAYDKRLSELSKCEVLCRACHKKETAKQLSILKSKPITHGTESGYRRGCRCVECKAGYSLIRKAKYVRLGN